MTLTAPDPAAPDAGTLFSFAPAEKALTAPPAPRTPTTPAAGGLRHVRALDGLRGIAVMVVVSYHLAPDLLPGGFLGVSLFFTLSGFLITNLLLAEWEGSSRIGLKRFWGRRFRRLLPASLLALAVGIAVAAVAADAAALRNLPGDVASVLAYVANWHFILSGNAYGAGFQQPSVVLQFWSLAIEEQFYVGVAIIAGLLARRTTTRKPWFVVFGGLAVFSMISTLVWYRPGDTARVYFGSDTRAFELLAGVLLALAISQRLPARVATWRGRHVVGLVIAAAFAVIVAITHTTDQWLYRGGFWGVAVLSCGLILITLDTGWLSRALSWRPLVAVGLISYGVYLFHWPLLIWLTPERTGLDGIPLAALRIAATLALAVPSYFLLEMPIRQHRFRLPALVLVPSVATIVVVLLVTGTAVSGDASQREIVTTAPDVALGTPAASAPAPPPLPADKVVPPLKRVLFLGDSLVHQGFPTIRDRLAAVGIEAVAIGGPGQSLMSGQGAWISELSATIAQFDPDLVVLESCCGSGNPWAPETFVGPDGQPLVSDSDAQYAEWAHLAAEATDTAEAGGRRAVWILAPPAHTNGYYGPIEGRIGRVNDIYTALVTCHAPTGLLDWRVIAAPDGSFTESLPDSSGHQVPVRAYDGLHFTPAGQALLADFTRDSLESYWRSVGGRNDGPLKVKPAVPTCAG